MGVLRSLGRRALRYSTQTGLHILRNLGPTTELTELGFGTSTTKDLDTDSHPSSNTSL